MTKDSVLLRLPSTGGCSALYKFNIWVELIEGQCASSSSTHDAIMIQASEQK